MKKQIAIGPEHILSVCHHIMSKPGTYAARSVDRASRIKTPGRHRQACLAAGRDAIAEVLFENYPELEGKFQKLTAAIRVGYQGYPDFEAINLQGAKALRLIK